jgi:hypothetical protein
MEKCFQRTLCEYEDFVNHYGTPTIICRRTGEIASVSKEFSLVTGWRRDVLLGKEPNLSVNTGSNQSGTQTGTSSRGAVTPRATNVDIDPGRPQPVFLAELMDEDSVVQFYEDFAELAFGASRASIIGRTVSLLKYKTKDDVGWSAADFSEDGKRQKRLSSSGEVKMDFMKNEAHGSKALGDRDGRVECSMCWTIKRDTFDIPMLIVMNVSFGLPPLGTMLLSKANYFFRSSCLSSEKLSVDHNDGRKGLVACFMFASANCICKRHLPAGTVFASGQAGRSRVRIGFSFIGG